LTLYKSVVSLIRAYNNIAPEMKEAGYSDKEAEKMKALVNEYTELRNSIKIASGDYIDLKKYEPEMRQLLDMYLSADPSRTLSNFGESTLLDLVKEYGVEEASKKLPEGIRRNKSAMAETLEANMRKVIIQEMPINPVYYEKMSTLLSELIRQRKLDAISYEEFLKKIEELAKNLKPESSSNYPPSINSDAKRALYDNLEENEELSVVLDKEIRYVKKDNWIGHTMKEREVKNVIKQHIDDPKKIEDIFEIVKNQSEYK
ncbi:MAG: restriction endonuclease subunit R, partial [Cyclobacteriaceae bacterium]